jgi:hypothetical protein
MAELPPSLPLPPAGRYVTRAINQYEVVTLMQQYLQRGAAPLVAQASAGLKPSQLYNWAQDVVVAFKVSPNGGIEVELRPEQSQTHEQ